MVTYTNLGFGLLTIDNKVYMNKQVNLTDINVFVVLAEVGSFTKAAEKLSCSRSYISKQLAQLESALGVTLLIRTTRTQYLTAQGEIFFAQCSNALSGISGAIDTVVDSSHSLSGSIKINCIGGHIGEDVVAPLINDFMNTYQHINIEIDFSSKRVDLISGEFDFVFRMGKLEDSALIAQKLTDIKIDTYVSPQYLSLHGKPTSPKELTQHKCIIGSIKNWVFTHGKTNRKLDVFVNGSLTCKNGRIMVSSAVAGNGVIRVPKIYCKAELDSGLLVPLFDDWHIDSTPFYLMYVKDQHQPARLRVFKEFIINRFKNS